MAGNVAARMSSLLPAPWGTGTRNNAEKRDYVAAHVGDVEYRTIAIATRDEAKQFERAELKANHESYLFKT
jgi:hypothetical protein